MTSVAMMLVENKISLPQICLEWWWLRELVELDDV